MNALADLDLITLTDRNTKESVTVTKWAVRAVLDLWYCDPGDDTARAECERVANAVENHGDLNGSPYLGLSIERVSGLGGGQ